MNAERTFLLGWGAFGLGFVLRGLARFLSLGTGWVTFGYLGAGLGLLVLTAIGYTDPEYHGVPSDTGLRTYGVFLAGVGLLVVGLVELVLSI